MALFGPDWIQGGSVFPLAFDGYTCARSLDKPLAACLEYLHAVLEGNLGSFWRGQLSALSLLGTQDFPDGYVVRSLADWDVSSRLEELGSNGVKFPLLSVHRERMDLKMHSIQQPVAASYCVLDYVLPPMAAQHYSKLQSFRMGVAKVAAISLLRGSDRFFLDGVRHWGDSTSLGDVGIDGVKLNEVLFDDWMLKAEGGKTQKGGAGLLFPVLTLKFGIEERMGAGPAYLSNLLQGINGDVSVIDPSDPTNPYPLNSLTYDT